MNANEIYIGGDSFAGHRDHNTDWPSIVTGLLTGQSVDDLHTPLGKGFPGCAWWSTRIDFLNILENHTPKVVILCHTAADRLYSDKDLSLHLYDSKQFGSALTTKERQAGKFYYECLYSEKFHNWAMIQYFEELDRILFSQNIEKSIHIYCHSHTWNQLQYKFKHGVTIRQPLFPGPSSSEHDPKYRNHFLSEQNIQLGTSLFNILNNYPGHNTIWNDNIVE